MSRRLLWLDCETTSVDPWSCRVIEVALFATEADGALATMTKPWVFRCNPGVPIDPGATEAHGIRDADLVNERPFADFAVEVQALLAGTVIAGYNVRSFDSILIDRELRLAGQPGLERNEQGKIVQPELDLFRLWKEMEPRSLEGAFKRFLGEAPAGFKAHGAQDDVAHLPELLNGMATALHKCWPASPEEIGTEAELLALAKMCVPDGEVDRDGKFKRDEKGVVRITFGKYGPGGTDCDHPDGTAASRLPTSYLDWMATKATDMPEDARAVARWFMEKRQPSLGL